MFWHGSNFGYVISNFICMTIVKTTLTATTKIHFNHISNYSGFHYVDDIMFVAYPIFFTQFFFYNWFEMNVPNQFTNNEDKLPFKMSENYAHYRDNFIRNMPKQYMWYSLFIYYAGYVCFYITFNAQSEIVCSDGKTQGIWEMGFGTAFSMVFFAWFLFGSNIKNWSRPMRTLWICVIVNTVIVMICF